MHGIYPSRAFFQNFGQKLHFRGATVIHSPGGSSKFGDISELFIFYFYHYTAAMYNGMCVFNVACRQSTQRYYWLIARSHGNPRYCYMHYIGKRGTGDKINYDDDTSQVDFR